MVLINDIFFINVLNLIEKTMVIMVFDDEIYDQINNLVNLILIFKMDINLYQVKYYFYYVVLIYMMFLVEMENQVIFNYFSLYKYN